MFFDVARKQGKAGSAGMFKPLTGEEADERLKEKYHELDKQSEIKSERLSAALFSKKKSPLTVCQKEKNSQGNDRRKGWKYLTQMNFPTFLWRFKIIFLSYEGSIVLKLYPT